MDAIKLYFKEIKDIPLLNAEEECDLATRIGKGDMEARKKLIRSNLRLVINIAKKYAYFGVPMMDLIEEGNMGLMKAVGKYNPAKGYRFSTYSAYWIRQYISRAIADQGKTIRIPVYMVETISRCKKVTERLTQKLHRKPTVKEVAKQMKLPVEKIREVGLIVTKTSSLEAPIGEGNTAQFMDLIEDVTSPSAIDELSHFLQRERISGLLDLMDAREKEILRLRYGLSNGTNHTLGETAKNFGITRERVRQIESVALKKLKAHIRSQEKQPYKKDSSQ